MVRSHGVNGEGPREACGLFGVWAPGEDVARLAYFGLYALQHRGQESAGIAVSDGHNILVYRELGLVSQVFDERTLSTLHGDLAIGHNRYSTTGSTTWENAQPSFKTDGAPAPPGPRPLASGRLESGWVLASETAALDIVGAEYVREVEPGELVMLDERGIRSARYAESPRPALCLFEFVYLARADSRLYGRTVHQARRAMGKRLAREAPA